MAMDDGLPDYDYGSCCACGKYNNPRNIITLSVKAPVPGSGWGCMQCMMPMDGAVAIICDECKESQAEIQWVVYDKIWLNERVLLSTCTEPFEHNVRYHPELNLN
jgi:hypothetical protein